MPPKRKISQTYAGRLHKKATPPPSTDNSIYDVPSSSPTPEDTVRVLTAPKKPAKAVGSETKSSAKAPRTAATKTSTTKEEKPNHAGAPRTVKDKVVVERPKVRTPRTVRKVTPSRPQTPTENVGTARVTRSVRKRSPATDDEAELSSDEISRPVSPSAMLSAAAKRKPLRRTYKDPRRSRNEAVERLVGKPTPTFAPALNKDGTLKKRPGRPRKKPVDPEPEPGPERQVRINGHVLVRSDDEADVVLPSGKIKTPARRPPETSGPLTQGLVDPFEVPDDPMEVDSDKETRVVRSMKVLPFKAVTPKELEEKPLGLSIKVWQETVDVMKRSVLGKVVGRMRPELVGLDEEFKNVYQLLEQTVVAGEGNSMLLIGARGCGKTALLEAALTDLSDSYRSEFHIVRLNGLLQTDDRIALREIWRQLGVEMELDENNQPKTTNFADTLSSILAILSHPDELQQQNGEDFPEEDPARTSMAVVFILDEFDLFATHSRQTLLYNLFDIAQAKKAPIAVIGMTSKVDVVDSLEKRVKSRFSHRTVHLKLPADVDEFWGIVKAGLQPDEEVFATLKDPNAERYCHMWIDDYLDALHSSPSFSKLLTRTFHASKTCAPIFNASILPLSSITCESPFPAFDTFLPSFTPPNSNLDLIPALSDIQLALLIAAARLEVLADAETVNFDMSYDEYLELCTKTRVQATPTASVGAGRVWGKQLAKAAWEGLEKVGLIVEAGRKGGGGLWRVDVGLAEIGKCVAGSQWAKWCRETA